MNPVTIMELEKDLNTNNSSNDIESICLSCSNSQKVALVKSKRNRMIMIDPDATCNNQGRFV